MPVASAAQALGIEVAAIYSSEVEEDAIAVALTHFPHDRGMGDICQVTESDVECIVSEHPESDFGIFGGLPCVDVSPLKGPARKGAMGPQSGLHVHFGRVAKAFIKLAPERAVAIMECTETAASDQAHYESVFGHPPYLLGAEHWVPMLRRRLWWHSCVPMFPPGTIQKQSAGTNIITVIPAAAKRCSWVEILQLTLRKEERTRDPFIWPRFVGASPDPRQ